MNLLQNSITQRRMYKPRLAASYYKFPCTRRPKGGIDAKFQEKEKKLSYWALFLSSLFIVHCSLLFCTCAILTEKSGQVLEGAAFAEKTLERYATEGKELGLRRVRYRKDGEGWMLELKSWPTLKFHFIEIPGENNGEGSGANTGNGSLIPLSCYFLGSALSGWNEFTMDLAGTGTITKTGDNTLTTTLASIELIDISGGRIRRGDARLAGNEALAALRNRRNRIDALTEWMRGYVESAGESPDFTGQKNGQKAFEDYWKPILLPELCPARKRPDLYKQNLEGAQWIRAEDVRWNTSYTALLFPEDLRILRDSGALLRDWEEAAAWIYLAYEWDGIIQTMARENHFSRTKR